LDDPELGNTPHNKKTLLFDLDGTLTDPSEGITRCIQHALECLGRPYPSQDNLKQYIGPSLRWTFPRLLGSDDEDLVEQAVRHFRERYGTVGLFENKPYPGVAELLASLRDNGYPMYVVTSKPTIYARRIIPHFRLGRYFMDVFGPELDGRFDEKSELVEHVLRQCGLDPGETVMIGDRARDIESGKANSTRTIGVTYGFGTETELAAARPDILAHSPRGIDPGLLDDPTAKSRLAVS
jgi:phosphoglycolate phosphatase